MTIRLTFPSGCERCAAWLTLPEAAAPHPVVLLIHGGGATHAMMLDQYERWFSAAGFALLAFAFRSLGQSGGGAGPRAVGVQWGPRGSAPAMSWPPQRAATTSPPPSSNARSCRAARRR